MKTPELWYKVLFDEYEHRSKHEIIAAIQLDAQRAAYAECARILETYLGTQEITEARKEILEARNNLKLP